MSNKDIIMEVIYVACGLMSAYVGYRALADKNQKNKIGTAVFWLALAALLALGRWMSPVVAGILVVIMTIPPIIKRVSPGVNKVIPEEYKRKMADKLGLKVFIPALTMGMLALIIGIALPKLGALVGLGFGILVSAIIILIMSKDSPTVVPIEGKKLLEAVGPLSILPQLLASLGAIFAAAGVGDVISGMVSNIVPEGNVTVAIIVYAVAMALFTMIMGNAFAAFSVITIGIGIPFILQYGLDPNVVGMIGLTSGYCGTLMTPMAANFNIVPVAILEMEDKYAVIKKQIPLGLTLLVAQIIIMMIMA
ncbi:DUF979 domain-containing protein [Clostridium cadaveris]|uniref:Uncharacterized membrane protein n=1 Tax=Clostridium cadaveris TaxID=1529 RepID=A0A1I2L5G7_9CLOT|nr:DUF979 domain-containing protein [Clostridium cadaveris]MDM8311617.1 DUF979 domain-containing protein [Clostridium cadaveris]NME63521.1 DUF979 domain-containing protein [Clostridium cadaveris]NWK09794.1 DUF979 domain-containing protein [Clostridium cadaveris]UFH64545.1 DUF979 domain-containing protein [Clostridium cadaveris]SFF73788.1 Uncharacterized membrane protein [Clostridium cadaveris]